jgi:hypothetical protein
MVSSTIDLKFSGATVYLQAYVSIPKKRFMFNVMVLLIMFALAA